MSAKQDSSYEQIWDHEWMKFAESFSLACCDCHLVHYIEIRKRNGETYVRFGRDNRATGQLRRHHKLNVKKPKPKS